MSVIKPLLNFGRSIGAKNFSEIKGLAKAIKGKNPVGACHLELTSKMTEALVKDKQGMQILRTYSPRTYAPDSKLAVDIAYRKLGQKSGIINVAASTKDAAGVEIASGRYKILGNQSGARVYGNATTECSAVNFDVTGMPERYKPQNFIKFLKNMKYNHANGMATLQLPKTATGGIKAQLNLTAPKGYLDAMTKLQSGGEFSDFGQLVSLIG